MLGKQTKSALAIPVPSDKEPAGRRASGLAHLMTALHQNAAAVVNSKTQLNGPDQILPAAKEYTTTKRNGCVKLRKEESGLGSEEPISVPTLLQDAASAYPDVVALKVKRDGDWKTWTYERYLREVQLVARGFIHIGLTRHHSVGIMGNNTPEWVISDLAAIFAGGIAVGLYHEYGHEEISRVALECKADIIVVENEALLKKVLLIQHKLPDLRAIVQLQGDPPLSDKRRLHKSHKKHIVSWSELLDIGRDLPDGKLDDRLRRIAINHCCNVLYSSGTNRPQRGVMLSHDNLTWCSKMVLGVIRAPGFNNLPTPGEEVIMSYLPHSEIASQTIDIFYTMSIVGTLSFPGEDMDVNNDTSHFFEAISEIQPTVFFGPPSAFERIYHHFREMKKHTSGVSRLILDWSNGALKTKHLKDQSSRAAPVRKLSQVRHSIAKNAVCKKYKEQLGFGDKTVFLCRGSPLAPEVLKYLAGFDILVHEMFGQSENCGLLSANIPKRYIKLGSTGKAVPGVKTKIIERNDEVLKTPMLDGGFAPEIGGICGWGRNICMGYLNKENETHEAMTEDHWLKLGDLGFYDEDGFISVLGKESNFITLSTGEVVSPLRIEQRIRLELSCIAQAMVVGEGQDYLAVLLTLQTKRCEKSGKRTKELTENAKRWFRFARYEVQSIGDVLDHLDHGLQHVIQAGIDRANQCARVTAHMICDWRIMPNQFTYEGNELGLTGKMKRFAILEKHAACIGTMFLHKSEHTYNSKCEATAAALEDVKTHLTHQNLSLIAEEDESSRRSSPAAERLRRLVLSKEELDLSETASIVESEDGVSKIQINPDQIQIQSSEQDMFKQVIEVKDTLDNELHRKISATLEPVSFEDETTGRN